MRKLIHGVAVRFYTRVPGGNLTMDFKVMGERVQESTGWPTLADAERVAAVEVRKLKELKQGLTAEEQKKHRANGKVATVGEVLQLLDGEEGLPWGETTLRTYKTGLRRLARAAAGKDYKKASLSDVLSGANIEAFYAQSQKRKKVSWRDDLEGNGGRTVPCGT